MALAPANRVVMPLQKASLLVLPSQFQANQRAPYWLVSVEAP